MNPQISICIPAFKNKAFLERLLDSIKIQSYRHFEVIVTDDSPDDALRELCNSYTTYFDLRYFKNQTNLNTPENWNEAVRQAKYEWIKIVHDDDWFVDGSSLDRYARAVIQNPDAHFFFSAYQNIYFDQQRTQKMRLSSFWKMSLKSNPEILLSRNVIGPPSVTLYKKTNLSYDRTMKYVVDIDFYTRYLENYPWIYIDEILVNVGIHFSQVTKYTFGVSDFQFNESIQMLIKKHDGVFKNILVYDGWWRLMRNFKVTSLEQWSQWGLSKSHSDTLSAMVQIQKKVSTVVLQTGLISKTLMAFSYLKYRLGNNF